MVDNMNTTNKGLEKAQQRFEQAKQALAKEVAKAREEKRRAETYHKCVMGGLIAKYLPECYQFEESELNSIIRAAVQSSECKNAIIKVKSEYTGNGSNPRVNESRTEQ